MPFPNPACYGHFYASRTISNRYNLSLHRDSTVVYIAYTGARCGTEPIENP